ncbi:MAG: autotransporter outer membrane beta-barrel domain-containing protein [Methyloligella sp. ZOD6]
MTTGAAGEGPAFGETARDVATVPRSTVSYIAIAGALYLSPLSLPTESFSRFGLGGQALAANECGSISATDPTVVCDTIPDNAGTDGSIGVVAGSDFGDANTYPNGVVYNYALGQGVSSAPTFRFEGVDIITTGDGVDGVLLTVSGLTPTAPPFGVGYDATAVNPTIATTVDFSGSITTSGNAAHGMEIISSVGPDGLVSANQFGGISIVNVMIQSGSSVTALGEASHGLSISSSSLWFGNGAGLFADPADWGCNTTTTDNCGGTGDGDIDVVIDGDVMGGWGEITPPAPGGPNHLAAGLFLDEDQTSRETSITIGRTGSLGALSDLAFDLSQVGYGDNVEGNFTPPLSEVGDDGFEYRPAVINNRGTITGSGYLGYNSIQDPTSLQFIADNGLASEVVGYTNATTAVNRGDTFNNDGRFNLRNFAKTLDGANTVRDLESVAFIDFDHLITSTSFTLPVFGPDAVFSRIQDGNDLFRNNGTLALAHVANPSNTDTTGQYTPRGLSGGYSSSYYSLARNGVEQGHIRDLETFINSGVVTMQDAETGGTGPVAGDVLVITGNDVIGSFADTNGALLGGGEGVFISNGGELHIDTVLNRGGPANSRSDVLVVDSTATGSGGATGISVANAGGSGGNTDANGNGLVDEGEGILVIEVLDAARSDANAFSLLGQGVDGDGNSIIVQGAWAYRLVGPGRYDVYDPATTSADWYLVSQLSPNTPVYESYPRALQTFTRLPTLWERVGNRYWRDERAAPSPSVSDCIPGSKSLGCGVEEAEISSGLAVAKNNIAWGRIQGTRTHLDPRHSSTASTWEGDQWLMQTGIDPIRIERHNGQLVAGLQTQIGKSYIDINSPFGNGEIDTTGYGLGGSATWYGDSGFYTDAQAMLSWFESDLKSQTLGQLADDNDADGYALSLEAGQRFATGYRDWVLTPQAQLTYADVSFDRFTDPYGATVFSADGESLLGRLGLASEREQAWLDSSGRLRRIAIYGLVNLYYEFSDDTGVTVSGTDLRQEQEPYWGGLTGGGTYSWNDDRYAIYGSLMVNAAFENPDDNYMFGGTGGFRMRW